MNVPNQPNGDHQTPSLRRHIPAVLLVALVLLLTSLAAIDTGPVIQENQGTNDVTLTASLDSEATPPPYPVESAPAATGIILGAAFLVLVILIGTLAATRRRRE